MRASGRKALVATMPMTRVGRARERGETLGFMHVLVDAQTKRILGAALLGIEGDEVVHSLLDAMYAGAPYTVIQRAMHIHPTVAELIPTLLGQPEATGVARSAGHALDAGLQKQLPVARQRARMVKHFAAPRQAGTPRRRHRARTSANRWGRSGSRRSPPPCVRGKPPRRHAGVARARSVGDEIGAFEAFGQRGPARRQAQTGAEHRRTRRRRPRDHVDALVHGATPSAPPDHPSPTTSMLAPAPRPLQAAPTPPRYNAAALTQGDSMAIKRFAGKAGTLVVLQHESKVLKDNLLGDAHIRKLAVWLPPQYDAARRAGRSSPGRRFPVLFDLVGFSGSGLAHTGWRPFSDNVPERVARLIHDRRMGPTILVFPDCFTALGGNQYVNSSAVGNYADYLTRELIPFVDREFRTLASREHRGCFGKSSGGYGAIIHGMKYPQHWGAIADHSGDSYFDFVYWHDWPNTLNELTRFRLPKRRPGRIRRARRQLRARASPKASTTGASSASSTTSGARKSSRPPRGIAS